MNLGYIDEYSWRCLLGPMSKDVEVKDGIYKWKVGKKTHIAILKELLNDDLGYLSSFVPFNFHYLSPTNLDLLKANFKVSKNKITSICLNIKETVDISGSKYRHIRNSVNRINRLNVEVFEQFKNIDDVNKLIGKWSETSGEKYFRDFSGKNKYFYKNNWHDGCINVFCYNKDELFAYGSLSPVKNGKSVYIIGKSLKEYSGASEFLDLTLYEKAIESGCELINMGRVTNGGMLKYKSKFRGAFQDLSYDGSAE